jgi:WD domain, G-beta repeat
MQERTVQMNQWLWICRYLGILLTLLIIPLNAINAAATHDHAITNTSARDEPSMAAVRSGSILPIGHSVGVDAVAFAPDGTLIASGNVDSRVRLWQTQTGVVGCPIGNGAAHLGKPERCRPVPRTATLFEYSERQRAGLARVEVRAEKNPEALLSLRQPEGQGRALRGSVIAGIPQT